MGLETGSTIFWACFCRTELIGEPIGDGAALPWSLDTSELLCSGILLINFFILFLSNDSDLCGVLLDWSFAWFVVLLFWVSIEFWTKLFDCIELLMLILFAFDVYLALGVWLCFAALWKFMLIFLMPVISSHVSFKFAFLSSISCEFDLRITLPTWCRPWLLRSMIRWALVKSMPGLFGVWRLAVRLAEFAMEILGWWLFEDVKLFGLTGVKIMFFDEFWQDDCSELWVWFSTELWWPVNFFEKARKFLKKK